MAQTNTSPGQMLSGSPQPNFTAYAPPPIIAKRSPGSEDVGYPLGQLWVNKTNGSSFQLTQVAAGSGTWINTGVSPSGVVGTITGNAGGALDPSAGNINIMGSGTITTSGTGSTLTINGSSNGFPITPFVVGPSHVAGYQTIQSAVTAAEGNGGGIVYIQPGTYTENITMTENVHLVGIVGTSGNAGLTITDGAIPSVEIIGNFTLNLTAAASTPTVVIKNIMLFASSGNVFTCTGNVALLESGYITFYNCLLQTGTSATAIFSIDGFFNITLIESVVNEETPNSNNLMTFGATPFINLNSRDSLIQINEVNACGLPADAFIVFTLENTFYTARIDLSSVSASFGLTGTNLFVSFTGGSSGDPLINFGSNDGSVIIQNCIVTNASGSFANSTAVDSASNFNFTNCIFNNALTLGSTGRGSFVGCQFAGYTDPAVTMSSSENVSFIECVFFSTNNPCIAGSGTGTVSLGDITFTSDSSIANTLTLAWLATQTGAFTVTGGLTTSGGAVAVNSGTHALGISTDASATTVSLATGAAAKSVTLGSTNTTSALTLQAGTGNVAVTGAVTTTYTIGSATGTGAITVGQSTAAETVNVLSATSITGAQVVNILDGATPGANTTLNVMNGAGTAGTQTVNMLASGATRAGAVNIGTGAAAHAVTIGSTTSTAGVTINTGASGTTAIVGSGGTINIGADAAANTVTVGSTNTTSTTNIKAGSGGIVATGNTSITGNLTLAAAGNKLLVTTGSNATVGTSGAMTTGAVTVSNSSVTSNSKIFCYPAALGTVTAPQAYYISAITGGVNFTITSASAADTSTWNYWIIN